MAERLNPGEETAAEADYKRKFNRVAGSESAKNDLKAKEAAGSDASWKTTAKKKQVVAGGKKGRFNFRGRNAGKLHHASAFTFIIGVFVLGIAYTSLFAPNIMMVNIKEMYTNDLADSTIALDAYAKKLMNYKLGGSNCGDKESIKCKLSTMPRGLKQSFEKHGFTVLGSKVNPDDGRDTTGQPTSPEPESRYQVSSIIMPTTSPGAAFTGDMLYLWGSLSSGNKALLYGVFNPKSSFYQDARFKQRLKTKYDLTKSPTVSGTTEQAVDKSFDKSMTGSNEGIDASGRPNADGGIGLGSLKNPVTAAQFQVAARTAANFSASYVSLECAWYSYGKAVMNDAKSAKAHTVARFAMQYLKAADQIKAGTSEEIAINTLSGKLAQSSGGGYDGPNATDSTMYKSIVHGAAPIPSPFGFLYYLDTFDLIGAMFPSWTQLMASATGLAGVTGQSGSLSMPPANLAGGDRDYCLSGETTENKSEIKPGDSKSTKCIEAINAMAFPGTQGLVTDATIVAGQTCPQPHYDNPDQTFEGEWLMSPSAKIVDATLTPYISLLFGANAIAWANAIYPFFTSQTTGVAASDAIFAGTGEVLGDMAMSRGMTPGNAATMTIYLAQKDKVENDFNEVARYNARKDPFDPYNKFSFLGSITHALTPTYNSKTPLFSTIANSLSLVGNGIKQLDPSANAIYYLQPNAFNPLRLAMCPDPEYLAILITADVACNVRYQMGKQELAAQPDSVIDYMTKSHSDAYKDKIQDLTERQGKADIEFDQANVARQLAAMQEASNKPFIDEKTGKPIKDSEYEKFMDYCVNRQDPWGRSAMVVHRNELSAEEKQKRLGNTDGNRVVHGDGGSPDQETATLSYPSITEGAKDDQDWYTGKKCLEEGSEMLTNFRAYTMLCSVDGSYSGGIDCTDADNSAAYADDFFTSNDILYSSWY